MTIRPARPGEAEALSALAREAKAHWGYPAEWLAAWRDALTVSEAFVTGCAVFVAAGADDTPLGWVALAGEPDDLAIEHLWVRPAAMGRGVGRALVARAREAAAAQGVTRLRIEADPHAAPFYERIGARRVGAVRADVCGVRRDLPLFELDVAPARAA